MTHETTTAPERLWAEPNTQIPASFGLWAAVSVKPAPGTHLVEYVRADLVDKARTTADDFVQVPCAELEWLEGCSDLQMGDGDTARTLAGQWLNSESAIDEINRQQRRIGLDGIDVCRRR